jgi:hypothetical protein
MYISHKSKIVVMYVSLTVNLMIIGMYVCLMCVNLVVVVVVCISHKHEPTTRLIFNNFAREKKLWLTFALQTVGIL